MTTDEWRQYVFLFRTAVVGGALVILVGVVELVANSPIRGVFLIAAGSVSVASSWRLAAFASKSAATGRADDVPKRLNAIIRARRERKSSAR